MMNKSNALRKTLEFFATISSGLLVSYIFSIIVAKGSIKLVTEHPNFVESDSTKIFEQLSVIGIVDNHDWMHLLLLVLIGLNVLRLGHSFFLLLRNKDYQELFGDKSLLTGSMRKTALSIFEIISQLGVIAIIFIGVIFSHDVLWKCGLLVLVALVFWDTFTYHILKDVDDEKVRALTKTFYNWMLMDGLAVIVALLAILVVGDSSWFTKFWKEATTSLALGLVLFADYVCYNRKFYWDSSGPSIP